MGAAEVISFEEVRARKQWSTLRQQLHERFDQWLDTLEQAWPEPPATLSEVSATVWDLRQQLTGGLTETIVAHAHAGERQRQQASCPRCARVLKVQEHVWRTVETLVGPVALERPYFYCRTSIAALVVWVSTPSMTRWVWWQGVNSSTCSTPRRSWSPKCRMTRPSRSLRS
jgi:hypothetical protein